MTLTSSPSVELSNEEIHRYSRHLILPEVTLEGQKRLKAASVLIIGAGGLGAPVSMYLAAACWGSCRASSAASRRPRRSS